MHRMNKGSNYTHYRYKTILSEPPSKTHKQSLWSSHLKDLTPLHTTRYKNIRLVQREEELKKTYTHRQLDSPLKKKSKRATESQELIEVARVKIHSTGNRARGNEEYTINRNDLKHMMKSKKQGEFSMTKSVEEIEKKYPKKIDVFINELKLKVAALEHQNRLHVIPPQKQFGPLTVLKNQRIMVRELIPKTSHKISAVKMVIKPRATLTEYEGVEVSGWEVEPVKDQMQGSTPKCQI